MRLSNFWNTIAFMRKSLNLVYLLLGTTALLVCWYYNFQHLSVGGSLSSFVSDNVVNPASASIFYDISFLFLSSSVWFYAESKRLGIRYWWSYVLIGLFIGISFSFPVFLIHRNYKLNAQ